METKENVGVLFSNQKKAETHPDFKGKINFNGKEMQIAAWKKTDKNGNTYLSLKLSEVFKKEISGSTGYSDFRIDSKDDFIF